MPTETVTKSVILPLETSGRKNDRVRTIISEWQEIAARMNELMPSLGPDHWRTQDSTLFRVVNNEFPNTSLRAHDAHQAAYKVAEAWGSWHSNRHEKERPQFGDGNFARLCHCGIEVAPNGQGYGVKLGLEPYKPEWFGICGGPYQNDVLERIVAGDDSLSNGSGELRLGDSGSLALHLSVSEDVAVPEWEDVRTYVGAHMGIRHLYSVAAIGPHGDIQDIRLENGDEFRHHRKELVAKRSRLMNRGKLREARAARNLHWRYTDQVTHTAATAICDFASQFDAPGIVLEDLTHIRETGDPDPSLDADVDHWPFAELQTKILYKATERGLPVKTVGGEYISAECRECGCRETINDRPTFLCGDCGYRVDVDVNASVNLAKSGC